MAGMPVTFSVVDYSGEPSRTTVYVEDLDNTNYDELFLAVTGKVTLLQAAFEVITGCTLNRTVAGKVADIGTGVLPSDEEAQREIAVRVSYRDTVTGKSQRMDIPGPIVTLYPGQGTDFIPLSNPVAAIFIGVFETNAVSMDGNPVTVTGLRLVGRNN